MTTTEAPTLTPPVRHILAGHAAVMGLGYLFGPAQWTSSSTFAVVHQLPIPVPMWGAVFLVAGALLLAHLDIPGHLLAAAASTFWGLCLGATLVTGQISGWGAPVYALLLAAPMHMLALWRLFSAFWRRSSARAAQRR